MKTLITLLTISFLCSCSTNTGNKKEPEMTGLDDKSGNKDWNYEEVGQEFLISLLLDVCSTKGLEFTDLYPKTDSITSDNYESLILVKLLRTKGFDVTNRARGNWMKGPRIVSFTMSDGECECQIDKLYYSTERENSYKVTERIRCKEAGM